MRRKTPTRTLLYPGPIFDTKPPGTLQTLGNFRAASSNRPVKPKAILYTHLGNLKFLAKSFLTPAYVSRHLADIIFGATVNKTVIAILMISMILAKALFELKKIQHEKTGGFRNQVVNSFGETRMYI